MIGITQAVGVVGKQEDTIGRKDAAQLNDDLDATVLLRRECTLQVADDDELKAVAGGSRYTDELDVLVDIEAGLRGAHLGNAAKTSNRGRCECKRGDASHHGDRSKH